MRNSTATPFLLGFAILLGLSAPILQGCSRLSRAGSEKTLLHVFAYTPLEGSTDADYQAFKKATGELVGQIPGLKRVWVGKLREPIPGGNDKARTYGVAMEFESVEALQAYAANPAHKVWEQVYEKVRDPGTTTLDIPGE